MARSTRPAFRQAADRIRDSISSTEYAPGSRLPADVELADVLGFNRATIGQAIRLLESEGLVYKHKKATYVSRITARIQSDRTGRYARARRESGQNRGAFDAEIRALGMEPETHATTDHVPAPPRVAEILGVSAEEVSVLMRARKMYADQAPVQIATSYLPLEIVEGSAIEGADTGLGGSISRLGEMGFKQTEITETMIVRVPEPDEAEILGMTEDQRVIELTHVGRTAEGRAVEVTIHVQPAHLWSLTYKWALDADVN
ncbi:GntR family transcriptional regulator [Streptomyces sp. NPDC099050]|uniref:GntR family transcriptional regulator n=1 Tax=Streptomyces sp. NPDC099050 TaxID=3366100 RepID=UPI0037F48C16